MHSTRVSAVAEHKQHEQCRITHATSTVQDRCSCQSRMWRKSYSKGDKLEGADSARTVVTVIEAGGYASYQLAEKLDIAASWTVFFLAALALRGFEADALAVVI